MHSLSINCSTVATATPPNPTPSSSIPLCPLHTIHTQAFAPPVRLVRLVRQVLQVRQPRPQKNPPTTLISIARATLHATVATVHFLATGTSMVFTSVTAAASLFQRGATRVAGYVSRWRSQHKSITPCVSVLQLLQLIFGNIQNPSAHLRIPGIGSHKEKTAATPQSRTK